MDCLSLSEISAKGAPSGQCISCTINIQESTTNPTFHESNHMKTRRNRQKKIKEQGPPSMQKIKHKRYIEESEQKKKEENSSISKYKYTRKLIPNNSGHYDIWHIFMIVGIELCSPMKNVQK